MGKRLAIALDLVAWMPMLALNGEARLWDLRRLCSPPVQPGRQLVTIGRRQILRLARHWPGTHIVTNALDWLDQLPTMI
jgi:hypothetical protein